MAGYRPITDMWMLTRGKAGYYGAFPAGFLERARFLLGVQLYDPVLHICGGAVRDYQSGPMKGKGLGPNDMTLDLDESLNPDFLLDARTVGVSPGDMFPYWTPNGPDKAQGISIGTFECSTDGEGPFNVESGRRPWAAALIDRPYTESDAEEYTVGSEVWPDNLNDLTRRALNIVRIGGRVGVLDYYWPRPPRKGVTLVACIGVTVGWGNRIRVFSVFERTCHNPLEHNVMLVGQGEAPEEPGEAAEAPQEAPETPAPPPAPEAAPAPPRQPSKRKRRKRAGLLDGFGA